jgi:hypothetical protein
MRDFLRSAAIFSSPPFSQMLYSQKHRAFLKKLFFAVLVSLCAFDVLAQSPAMRRDSGRSSRGRDFYLAFLPNVHEQANSSNLADSLIIFITGEQATSGQISARDRLGGTVTRSWSLTDPTQILRFAFAYRDFEVQGFNWEAGTRVNPNSQNERVAPQSFRVTSQNDVNVYALHRAFLTSDAMLVFPTNTLGREYVVMSYKSDGGGYSLGEIPGNSTASQFAVIATDDNTSVRILPRAPTLATGNTTPRTVTLNRGDVYLVQADISQNQGLTDLTGSRVIATKPVAVISGHQRAVLPSEFKGQGVNQLSTRDHLCEQLQSVDTWGKSLFLTPYVTPSTRELPIGTDLYRVLAAYDNTKVFLNGEEVRTLNAGDFYEAPLVDPGWITASDQIMVAQFKKTSSSQDGRFNGDPFMMFVPMVEQYDKSYRFINPTGRDRNLLAQAGGPGTDLYFTEHYVTIVAPTSSVGSVRLDENLVGAGAFRQIVNTGYSFANLRVSDGVHTARGDSAFGIYVYGYGFLDAYGYIGGGKLRVIAPDRDPPQITGRAECFGFSGTVYDTLLTDSRIASVSFEQTTLGNVRGEIDAFTPFADSVKFRLRLINQFQDGSITVVARDSIGFVARRTISIPGMTVGSEGQGAAGQPRVFNVTVPFGRSRSVPINIINYGAFQQTLGNGIVLGADGAMLALGSTTGLAPFVLRQSCDRSRAVTWVSLTDSLAARRGDTSLVGRAVTFTPSTTNVLQSATTINININALQEGVCQLVLTAVNGCATRDVAIVNVVIQQDTSKPDVAATRDDCARTVTFSVRDGVPAISGLRSVEVLDLVNCTLTNVQPITAATVVVSQVQGLLSIQDPRRDAIYTLRAVDSTGNVTVVRDTVQGFTLQILGATRDTLGRFGPKPITTLPCRTLTYRNIGLKPFAIDRLPILGNQFFSFPQNQFAAFLQPNETRVFTLCFSPLEPRTYLDTVRFTRYCVDDVILLSGSGIPLERFDSTRCNADIRLTTAAAPLQYYMEQNYPNPSSSRTTIRIALVQPSFVTLTLYDALGTTVAQLVNTKLPEGVIDVDVDVSRLERGVYFYALQNGAQRTVKKLIIGGE